MTLYMDTMQAGNLLMEPGHACRRAFLDPYSSFDLEVCGRHWWLNFAFVNNQQTIGGCFNISWSLAVQMQFYLLLPVWLLLLRPKAPGFRRVVKCLPACMPPGELHLRRYLEPLTCGD